MERVAKKIKINDSNICINVVGAGLAGCEAANYIANKGYIVNLFEMKPQEFTRAHKSSDYCELICSNSFKNKSITSATGLLKQELIRIGSLIMKCAYDNELPAGSALAVDRDNFSKQVTYSIKSNPNINIVTKRVNSIDELIVNDSTYTIICSGPLTTDNLADSIMSTIGDNNLYFYDAIAPTLQFDEIDFDNAYMASRYSSEDKSYINCPLTKEDYDKFYNFLVSAETVKLKKFEEQKVFEGCMPVEVLAKRGYDSLRYGPMKPVGLTNPHTNSKDYAVIQLRQDNLKASIYNMVGFQTNLTFPMQQQLLKYIPALKNCKILRFGVMHRNTYLDSPNILNKFFQIKSNKNVFFGGQITGVEGYLPSTASGLVAAINCIKEIRGKNKVDFSSSTVIGSLQNYISTPPIKKFLPMNANYGIMTPLPENIRNKTKKYEEYSKRSLEVLEKIISDYEI